VFDGSTARMGKAGGAAHFGFRMVDPKDIDRAAEAVKKAEGRF
jgi:hypothetical protein